ncbi:MAG: excinuclease ABC subunit UvrC [Clostridiales bacterium]|nr:excinuclease ABC subunit UvrC [Clostridiales bacterium]
MVTPEKLKDLPDTPGVYIMRDADGKVIYVGKAVILSRRVRQYFQHSDKPVKVQAMVDNIADFDYIITRTEKDALALENNLIKKYKPHYNILLKDDKTNPYIRIDTRAEFPSIEVTRRVKRDGARYFGPFIGVSVRDVIAILQSVYRLRTCSGALKKRARPCLNHDIDLCLAPCCGMSSRDEYMKAINGAMSFLSGGNDDISGVITKKMNEAAESENFERAISYRNQLSVLNNLKSKVVGETGNTFNIDAFYYTDNGLYGAVSVCIVRGGKMMGVKNYIIDEPQVFGGDMTTFLPQYYSITNELPDEICLQSEIDFTPLAEYFQSVFSKRPTISFPQKGLRKKLLDTAARNCTDYLLKSADRVKREADMTVGACERVKTLFGLKKARRIECYDISDISGEDKVASQVVFIDGKADKAQYRRYKIRTVEGADDFRSMYETLTRRLLRYKNGDAGFNELPDLIVIDGGAEQVEFASRAADDVGVKVAMVGLAKKDEEIYMRGVAEPIRLKRDDYALKLLQRVRDEAHRFAVLYHRTVRSARYESELKSVEGVGAATVKKVLAKFNTRSIVAATAAEIAEKAGISKKAAQNIYEYYHPLEIVPQRRFRLIACDLDGTLLNDELTVSKRNLAAINAFRAQGGIFTVATGRSQYGVVRDRSLLGLDVNPVKMACHLGSLIVDSGSMEVEYAATIKNENAARIVELAAPHCKFCQMYSLEKTMTDKITELNTRYFDAVGINPIEVGELSAYARRSDEKFIKVVIIIDERKSNNLIDVMAAELSDMQFVISTAPLLQRLKNDGEDFEPVLIECTAREASKGEALKRIAAHYGIDMSEVMAFGDSFNDIPMIKAAGLGVAMGNARQPIKLVADLVADDNNADGVAKVIEEYCLGGAQPKKEDDRA